MRKIAQRKNDLRLYADELGKGLVGELDYTSEAENALEFKVFDRFLYNLLLPFISKKNEMKKRRKKEEK